MSRHSVLWALAALLGLVLAAGITWATSQLTSQRIGISSEPISAGERLVPQVVEHPAARPQRTTPTPKRGTTPPPSVPSRVYTAPSAPVAPAKSAPVQGAPSAEPTHTQTSGGSGSTRDDGGDRGGGQGGGAAGGGSSSGGSSSSSGSSSGSGGGRQAGEGGHGRDD